MKSIKMKGKTVNDAVEAALAVLGAAKEKAEIKILEEGKPAMMGIIGGEEAEVEVCVKEGVVEEARQALQTVLDKMSFLAMVDGRDEEGRVLLTIKGEDMGRIIGKGGAMLESLEIIIASIVRKIMGEPARISIDAGDYRQKKIDALERLAADVASEVEETGQEKILPWMSAADRRIIHLALQKSPKIASESRGEGKDRRLVVFPR